MPLKDLLYIAAMLMMVIGGVVLAVTYVFSRVRKASDELREEYIRGLERDRTELKSDNADKDKLNSSLRSELSELRGQVRVLQDLVLNGHCRQFVKDPVTGGCSYCSRGLPPTHRCVEDERG